jgi:hypothetical protein
MKNFLTGESWLWGARRAPVTGTRDRDKPSTSRGSGHFAEFAQPGSIWPWPWPWPWSGPRLAHGPGNSCAQPAWQGGRGPATSTSTSTGCVLCHLVLLAPALRFSAFSGFTLPLSFAFFLSAFSFPTASRAAPWEGRRRPEQLANSGLGEEQVSPPSAGGRKACALCQVRWGWGGRGGSPYITGGLSIAWGCSWEQGIQEK